MNVVQEIRRINERELQQGLSGKASWHHEYKDSAWVYVGGFRYDLTEGDLLCVMSQWGEIEDINLCREKDTGKSKGFGFIKYEDQRSTILAVDNFNGIELLGRTVRVDHKHKYSLPAEVRERAEKLEEERLAKGEEPSTTGAQWKPGIAYEGKELATAHNFHKGVDVFAAPDKGSGSSDDGDDLGVRGESLAAKRERREAKRARKEARREARGHKKHKSDRRDSADDHHRKKHKKDKKDDRGEGRDRKQESSAGDYRNGRDRAGADGYGESRRNGRDRGSPTTTGRASGGGGGGADADGTWERGARPSGDASFGASSALSAPPRQGEAPAPLSTGNVMDWRGLGGRGAGGRGGRGRGRGTGRGGREGGRGGGRGGRGGEGMNSLGGMDRRR